MLPLGVIGLMLYKAFFDKTEHCFVLPLGVIGVILFKVLIYTTEHCFCVSLWCNKVNTVE